MRRLKKAMLVLCAIATGQGMVATTTYASEVKLLMQQLDTDNDGLISLKEAIRHTALLRNFGLIDDDQDGKLSEEELNNSALTPKSGALTADMANTTDN